MGKQVVDEGSSGIMCIMCVVVRIWRVFGSFGRVFCGGFWRLFFIDCDDVFGTAPFVVGQLFTSLRFSCALRLFDVFLSSRKCCKEHLVSENVRSTSTGFGACCSLPGLAVQCDFSKNPMPRLIIGRRYASPTYASISTSHNLPPSR